MNKKQLFLATLTILIVAVSLPVLLYEVPRALDVKEDIKETKKEVVENEVVKSEDSVVTGVNVQFKAGTHMFEKSVPAGLTAFEFMNLLASTTNFRFKAKEFSGLGFLVQEIDGVKNEGGTYWTFYMNGQYSNVGASSYIVKDGDVIEWKYEKK